MGGFRFGGGGGQHQPYPTRGEVVALLQQVLPPGAPQPTEEDIEFLMEQFLKLEPGTALSFDPALLGQSGGGGTSDPLGRLQLDVAFGPPPLLPSSPSPLSDGFENCMGIDDDDDALLLPPAHRLHVAAVAIPVGERRNNDVPSSSGKVTADPNSRQRQAAGREEGGQRRGLGESEPAALPTKSARSSPQSSQTFNHSSIRDALRRVKDQVRAVERLRSSIELDEKNNDSRKIRRPQ